MPEVRAHIPKVIFINTLFDTQAILKVGKSTNKDKPVGLDHKNIFMVVESTNLVQWQATGDLIVTGQVNDTLNWRCQAVNGSAEAVFFNKFTTNTPGIIATPEQRQSQPKVAIPNADNPYAYHWETITDTYWKSELLKAGETDYKVYFAIQYEDDAGNQAISYYWWDPKVKVTQ